MTQTDVSPSIAPGAGIRPLVAGLARLGVRHRSRSQQAALRRSLLGLDDHMLRDIGRTRAAALVDASQALHGRQFY